VPVAPPITIPAIVEGRLTCTFANGHQIHVELPPTDDHERAFALALPVTASLTDDLVADPAPRPTPPPAPRDSWTG